MLTDRELGELSNLALEEAGPDLDKAKTIFVQMQTAFGRELKLWLAESCKKEYDDLLENAGFSKRFDELPLAVWRQVYRVPVSNMSVEVYRGLHGAAKKDVTEWFCDVLAAIILCPKEAFIEACTPRYGPSAEKLANLFDIEPSIILFRSAILGEYGD